MDIVKIPKDDLLKAIQENKVKHMKEYDEAVEGFREDAVKAIDKAAKNLASSRADIIAGKTFDIWDAVERVKKPFNHVSEYDRAIKMLEMTKEKVIEISTEKFGQLVMDEWHWKEQFTRMSGSYSNKRG